jgi:hypothetical protein
MAKISDHIGPPERMKGETQEQYKLRRLTEKALIKVGSKGRILWPSKKEGTFIKRTVEE